MDKKSIIKQIASLFSTQEETVETPINFVDVKTQDNRIMRVSDLAVDAEVQEILEDGTLVPVEDGEYILEDGTVVSVLAGKIAEISTPEEEAQDAEEEVVSEEMEAEVSEELAEEVAEVEVEAELTPAEQELLDTVAKLKELMDEMKTLKEGFESIKKENEELKVEVAKFSAAPSTEPTKTKVDFKATDKKSKLEFFSKR